MALVVAAGVGISRYDDGQTAVTGARGGAGQAPPPGHEEHERPDQPAPLPAVEGQGFRYSAHQDDGVSPVGWSPCRPVHYVVRPAHAPAGGAEILAQAVRAVSAATGLEFVYDSETDEGPSEDRRAYQPDRYGDRWAPVLVAWATPDEVPDFGVDIAGEAGPQRVTTASGDTSYVSGEVFLDGDAVADIAARAGAGAATAVVAHEFGHLVGLAHVNDPHQVMYPRIQATLVQYGSGDLAGLDAVGRTACQPDI